MPVFLVQLLLSTFCLLAIPFMSVHGERKDWLWRFLVASRPFKSCQYCDSLYIFVFSLLRFGCLTFAWEPTLMKKITYNFDGFYDSILMDFRSPRGVRTTRGAATNPLLKRLQLRLRLRLELGTWSCRSWGWSWNLGLVGVGVWVGFSTPRTRPNGLRHGGGYFLW